ncbi:hypothetical protein ABC766_29685 [Methylobacterium fujisawaense]|uniref:hypothetical protein n=1 Tax=Methylobacterium fujisawaense TaxID=107400 RepID=UPI0031F47E6D
MAESSTITREPPVSTTPVPILYVNWRGETSVRRIVPGPTWFGSTEWHPEPQWLMTADEPDTGKRRDFALAGIKAWGEEAVACSTITTNGTVRIIPAEEPVFLLRGQDVVAADTVRWWVEQAENVGAAPDIIAVALEHADRMEAWPKKKVADLSPALATGGARG